MGAADRDLTRTRDGSPAQPARRTRLLASWLVWWVVCGALWMVLDDTTVVPELIDGAVAASMGATAATIAIAGAGRAGSAPSPSQWGRWRPLWRLVADLPALVAVLARAIVTGDREPGGFRTVAYPPAADPAARRRGVAAAIFLGSLAPRTVVVDADREPGALIVHQLVAGDDGPAARRSEAR